MEMIKYLMSYKDNFIKMNCKNSFKKTKKLLTNSKTDDKIVKVFSRRRRTIKRFKIINVKKL